MATKNETQLTSEHLAAFQNEIVERNPQVVKRKPTQRQQRQQLLAALKFQCMSMQGNIGPLRSRVRSYNKSASPEESLRTLERDLNILQGYVGDVLLEINMKFAAMRLETMEAELQKKSK